MTDILVKDNKNKLFEVLMQLRNETELLICQNINQINKKTNRELQIETYVKGLEEYLIKEGYQKNQGLYDRVIIEYNQSNDNFAPLQRWK